MKQPGIRGARVPMAALAAAMLAACSGSSGDGVMSGYAEAVLVYVASPTGGTLSRIDVRRGDTVKRGQTLYALDADAQVHGREGAVAREAAARAQLRNLGKGQRPLELRAIDEQLAQAQAALEASGAALRRSEELVRLGFQSPAQLDALKSARDRDAAQVAQIRAQRGQAAQAARSDEVAAAAATARASAADVALARWQESQRERAAPVDASVYDVLYRAGEWVSAGAPVVALLPTAGIKLRFYVPEPLLSQASVGREVAVACDGCATGLSARIRFVSPQAEFTPPVIYSNSSRHKLVFLVEAEPLQPAAFKPGQPVDVRFAGPAS